MEKEILSLFPVTEGSTLLDATVGLGGHAKAYLSIHPTTHVVGLDVDAAALAIARQNLSEFGDRAVLEHRSYAYLDEAASGKEFEHILFDLGIGSHQLADTSRGMSFKSSAPLVMRFNADRQVPLPPSNVQVIQWLEQKLGFPPDAEDIIRGASEAELADIIRSYGGERYAGRIASAMKRVTPDSTAADVANAITKAVPASYEHGRIHPATRTFQALRIVVNRELESIEMGLPKAVERLVSGGVLIVLSFHSLEDRIVKQFFKSRKDIVPIHKKPLTASEEEQKQNPRSRSVKLRVAQKH